MRKSKFKLSVLFVGIMFSLAGCGSDSSSSTSTSTSTATEKPTPLPENFDQEFSQKIAGVSASKLSSGYTFNMSKTTDPSDRSIPCGSSPAFETSKFIVGKASGSSITESDMEEFAKVVEAAYSDVLKELSLTSSDMPSRTEKFEVCVGHVASAGGAGNYGGISIGIESGDTPKDTYRMAMHELTHMVEIELIHGTSDGERWFSEGVAYLVGQKEIGDQETLTKFTSATCFDRAPAQTKDYYQSYPENKTPPGMAYARDCMETEYPTFAALLLFLDKKYGLTKAKIANLWKIKKDNNYTFEQAFNTMMSQLGHTLAYSDLENKNSAVNNEFATWLEQIYTTGSLQSDHPVDGIYVATSDYYYGDIDSISVRDSTGTYRAYLGFNRDGKYQAYYESDNNMYGPVEVKVINKAFKDNTIDLRGASLCSNDDSNC